MQFNSSYVATLVANFPIVAFYTLLIVQAVAA